MLLRHFNLREQPFGVTPDPRFLFDTPTHREALAGLLYGIESGLGFIALTATPGMGKTTLLFEALSRLGKTARTVFLFQAIPNPTELVRALLIDLGEKDPQGSLIDLETRLNEILLQQSESGRRLVVVLDEAQNLDHSVLEAVRMLSNFETARYKLMQIILSGQPQLADRLAEPGLLQLKQRISIFASLKPLTHAETAEYINYRLGVAGYHGTTSLFTFEAVSLIARYSGGIPRNINNLCFNSLSLGCALKKSAIDAEIVREAIGDLEMSPEKLNQPITIYEVDKAPHFEANRPPNFEANRPAHFEADRPLHVEADRVPSYEPDRSPRELSLAREFSEERPVLRFAVIAALLFAIAATGGYMYLAHRGGINPLLQTVQAALKGQTPAPAKEAAATPPLPSVSSGPSAPASTVQTPSAPQASPALQDDPAAQPSTTEPQDSLTKDTVSQQTQAPVDSLKPSPSITSPSRRNSKKKHPKLQSSKGTSPIGAVQLIQVRKGQTVAGICVAHFGGCSQTLMDRIIGLNPQVADPDKLQAGERLILPVIDGMPGTGKQGVSGVGQNRTEAKGVFHEQAF
jgi:type II secretory pathway predicted ATPase ExeA